MFVYAAGQLIAEYSTAISQTPSVSYTTSDHLGSPRVITNELGQVSSRRDFMPFGEELYAGVGNRTGDTGLKYSSTDDDIRQKFTGYQKDNETNLDFAEARMYANNFGRFTAVDPLLASGRSADPQSFNRYVYTSNNPIIYAEVSIGFKTPTEFDAAFPPEDFLRRALPFEAAFIAGKAHVEYRRRGGVRMNTLPDFFIGAHAAVAGFKLLTRDPRRFKKYFPSVELIAP